MGTTAAVLTSFGFVPQIMKMWRTKSVGDVSLATLLQFTAGVALWAIYGMLRADLVIVAANLTALLSLAVGLFLYVHFGGHRASGRRRAGDGGITNAQKM